MEQLKIFDSELKIMEILWEREPVTAKDIARAAAERFGWNKNTTYTVINKLISKNAIKKSEPHFTCVSLVHREDVRREETKTLIDRLYGGSKKAFFASFVEEHLSEEELKELLKTLDKK